MRWAWGGDNLSPTENASARRQILQNRCCGYGTTSQLTTFTLSSKTAKHNKTITTNQSTTVTNSTLSVLKNQSIVKKYIKVYYREGASKHAYIASRLRVLCGVAMARWFGCFCPS
jgi:hypothetical protein